MTSLTEAFGLGRGCFGREGVLRGTGTFPETGGDGAAKGALHRLSGGAEWSCNDEELFNSIGLPRSKATTKNMQIHCCTRETFAAQA